MFFFSCVVIMFFQNWQRFLLCLLLRWVFIFSWQGCIRFRGCSMLYRLLRMCRWFCVVFKLLLLKWFMFRLVYILFLNVNNVGWVLCLLKGCDYWVNCFMFKWVILLLIFIRLVRFVGDSWWVCFISLVLCFKRCGWVVCSDGSGEL